MPEEVFKYLGLTRDRLANELSKKRTEIQKEVQSKNIEGLGPKGFMKPTLLYFLRAIYMRERLVVVLPLFCPVAATKTLRAI